MADMTAPLVGREREMEIVEQLLDRTRARGEGFLFVTGEPGIGKTRMLTELRRLASERGWLALHGSAAEFERELPFGLVVDAIDDFLASLDPQLFERLADEELTELAGVFPALRSLDPGSDHPTTAAERFRAHRAVTSLLEHLSEAQPVLLALDDLHWADGASLELVAQLLRRRPAGAVMVAATYRPGQADRALVSALDRGLGEADHRIDLGPLPRTQAQVLVDAADAALFDRLYDASGGNPFYLLELARLREGAGELPRPELDPLGLPAAVAAATVEELEGLSRAGRGLADGAAVAGDPFELDLAAAAADMSESDGLDALDQLMARDLVRATHVPRRFRFRHPLVRRAVYESCSPGTRITAHRRAADALAARGETAAVRAHHVAQSAQQGDMQAVALLRQAGDSAARRAPGSAARWFSAALDLLPASAPPAERIGLLTARAGSQAATGRFEESRAALIECIELVARDDVTARVPLICACAAVEQMLGHHEAARDRLSTALVSVPDAWSPEAVDLMIHLAAGDFYRMDYEGMRGWGERALRVAEELEEPLAAACLSVLAVAVAFTGPAREAEAYRATAAALVDTLPDRMLEGRLDALTNLSAADLYLHRYDDAAAHARRGMAIARAAGHGELGYFLIPVVVTVLHTTGRVSEAGDLLDEAVEMSRLSGNVEALGWNLLSRAYVAVAAGDLELARQAAAESVEVTGGLDDHLVSTYARWALASALLEAGDAARATDLLLAAAGGNELPRIPEPWRAHLFELLTRCWLALDRPLEAERSAERAGAIASRVGFAPVAAMAHRAAAAVALARGDAEVATERALAAAALAEEGGARVEAGRARTLAGRALAAGGDRDRALEELERAAGELAGCEAHRYHAEAEHELRRLGRRFSRHTSPHDPSAEGVDALTPRELEVARLVVDRRTNPQIARALVLSEKTIESHMRNIFRKLHVSSRADVAREMERAGV